MQTLPAVWSHRTIWHRTQRDGQSSRCKGTPIGRSCRDVYNFFCRRSPLRLLERKALTATVSRLAGDCELNGMREFTWGPVRGWVTARHADWPAVAVAAVTLVNRGRWFPNVRDVTASAYDDSLRVPCRHDAASFFHASIYRVTLRRSQPASWPRRL